MKLLQSMLFTLLLVIAVSVQASDQGAQLDLLWSKITAAVKNEKPLEALPAFAQMESIASSQSTQMPEDFSALYIGTLYKIGNNAEAYSRAEVYMSKYGKKGRRYAFVLDIMSRSQDKVVEARRQAEEAPRVLAEISRLMVRVPGFNYELGKYEVTQAEWRAVMGYNPSGFRRCGDNCPVENVSWDDIQVFLQMLKIKTGRQYRLPTDAEWEYACYGGSKTEYCGGNNLDAVGWYDDNSGNQTHQVGQKQANGYGLYDMSGNVEEWMEDVYDSSAPDEDDWRSSHGGSWRFTSYSAGAVSHGHGSPKGRYPWNGFRIARTLP